MKSRGAVDATDLHEGTLYTDELVVIVGAQQTEVHETLDLATFVRLPHASFRRENAPEKSFAERQLAQNNLLPPEAVLVSDFLLLGFVVASTQCAALFPGLLAEKMRTTAGLRLFEPPFPCERLHVQAYWSHEAHTDPGHTWFRGLMKAASTSL